MRRLVPASVGIAALVALLSSTAARTATEYDYAENIKAIATDIAGLRDSFPQLKDFSPSQNVLFLILEGKTTKPLADRLAAILNAHGLKPCS